MKNGFMFLSYYVSKIERRRPCFGSALFEWPQAPCEHKLLQNGRNHSHVSTGQSLEFLGLWISAKYASPTCHGHRGLAEQASVGVDPGHGIPEALRFA